MSDSSLDPRGGIQLLEFWRILRQRRWVVVACLAITLMLTALGVMFTVPVYQATVTLQIDRRAPDILTFQDVVGIDPSFAGYDDFYQTQYIVLQSKSVVRLAAERLDLANWPEFAARRGPPIARFLTWLRSAASSPAPSNSTSNDKPDPRVGAASFIHANMRVVPVRRSHLVQVSFDDRSPDLAREVANAIADAYLEFNYDAVYGTTKIAREFLTKEVVRVQGEIADLEEQLQDYGAKKQILTIDSGTKDISLQALAVLNEKLVDARGRLAVAAAHWETVKVADAESLPEVLASSLISSLKQQYATVERQRLQIAEQFGPEWPALRQIEHELEQAGERLHLETESIASQVRGVARTEFLRAKGEVDDLAQQLQEQKEEVQRVNRDAVEFASLKAEIESKRRVLAELASRQSQTAASERLKDTGTSNIRVVDKAETPKTPIRPRKFRSLLLAFLVGIALGCAAAFFLDFLDNTVKNEQDVMRAAGAPVLGYVPRCRNLRAVSGNDASGATPDLADVDVASHDDPRSAFAEAFKNLRTALLLASPEHPPRYIVVTSCEPQDGKSTVSSNLAIVLAQLGKKVLLIDADLRRPRIHRSLGVPNDLGLSNLLSGNARTREVLLETDVPGLSVVVSGPIPPNPSELLGSPALRAFLTDLEQHHGFDHVILDSPPVGSVTDPVLLSAALDITVVVVRAGKTTRESLALTIARLRQSHVRIAGIVLNDVTENLGSPYYGRYRAYHPLAEETPEATLASPRFRILKRLGRKAKGA